MGLSFPSFHQSQDLLSRRVGQMTYSRGMTVLCANSAAHTHTQTLCSIYTRLYLSATASSHVHHRVVFHIHPHTVTKLLEWTQ